jgi:hypothetical protein
MLITPAAAIEDPNLLGNGFAGPSWNRWRSILKAAWGEPLTATERAMFAAVSGNREAPTRPVKELWCIVGRRGGKDSVAAAIAVTFAMSDYRQYMRPGELASIVLLAVDRAQAHLVLRYIRAYFHDNAMLSELVVNETNDGIILDSGIEIIVTANSFRSIRGRTVLCAIMDEVSMWRSEESATPDIEIYNALRPSMVTIPSSMLIGITTAYRKFGLAYDKWKRHFGQSDDNVLVVHATSKQFNPLLPDEVIDSAIEADPEAASAEWLSQWRSDLADYIDRAVVEAAVEPSCHERPYLPGRHYVAFVDPSGGSGDSMTMAIGHNDRSANVAILDVLREVRPPFSPEQTVDEFVETLKNYKINRVQGDRYAGEWPREQFRKRGITYQVADKSKSDLYVSFLPLLNSKRVSLLDHSRAVSQLCSLERRTTRTTGKNLIDHPVGSHDDLANVIAGVLVAAAAKPVQHIDPGVLAKSMLIRTRPTFGLGPSPARSGGDFTQDHSSELMVFQARAMARGYR